MPSRNRQNPRRHRRRKERRLPRLGRGLQNGIEIVGEPHVEHLVGLVEDEHLQRIEPQRRALQVIERAAWRGDDDVGAAFEGADLLVHRRAAVKRQDREPHAFGVLVDRLGHLHRELAGRHQHEPAGLARTGMSLANPLQHRQRERGGLARAGAGLAEEIASFQQQRNRFALNRRRLLVSKRRHAVGERAL